MERSLLCLHGAALADQLVPIGERLCLGRRAQDGVDRVIDDKLLSSRHATIARTAGGYELVDHDSKNGSFVDGERVTRRRLGDGAIIRLGVHVFELTKGGAEVVDASAEDDASGALLGRSPGLRAAVAALDALEGDRGPVLLVGEHGTGKEAAARRLHQRWQRSGPLLTVDCNALGGRALGTLFGEGDADSGAGRGIDGTLVTDGDGLVQRAHGGTLLVDAVDALDRPAQERLAALAVACRAGACDLRLVATTEVDLDQLVDDGSFAPALYQLLAPRLVELPPLRSRRADVPLLCRHVWRGLGGQLEFSATCLEKLLLYDWPMNVRELAAVMQRLHGDGEGDTLRSARLPREFQARVREPTLDQLRASAVMVQVAPSREELAVLLARFEGNASAVADFYARDKRQVFRWLKRHDLRPTDFRKP